MAAPKPISNLDRQKLNAPQIGEGIWAVYDSGGACVLQIVSARADVNGLTVQTAATGAGPLLTVQGADTNIDLNLAALGTGVVHILSGLLIGGSLEVVGATTLDSTLLVKGAATFQAALTQSGGTAAFDSPTLVVDETTHRVGVGTVAPIALLDVTNGYIRALNGTNTVPATGLGLDLVCSGGVSFLQGFDHSNTLFTELDVDGNPLKLNTRSLAAVTISGPTTITKSLTQSGGNAVFDTTTLVVDETNHLVGIGTASPGIGKTLDVVGTIRLTSTLFHSSIAASQIVPSSAGWIVLDSTGVFNNLALTNAGAATLRSSLTITANGLDVTGLTALHGQLSVTTGGIDITGASVLRGAVTVTTGGVDVTGTSTLRGAVTVTTGGLTVTLGGVTINGGDLTLATAKFLLGTDTWLLPTGLGSTTIVTLAGIQTLTGAKTFSAQLTISAGGLLVQAGGASISGALTVVTGGLTVSASGAGITGNTSITSGSFTQSGGNAVFDTSTLVVDETNHRVGIGTASPGTGKTLDVVGTIRLSSTLFHSSTGASQIVPSSAGWVVLDSTGVFNNFAMTDVGVVTIRGATTITGGGLLINAGGFTLTGGFNWVVTATAPSAASVNLTTPGTGGPTSKAVAGWIPLSLNGTAGWTPWFQ